MTVTCNTSEILRKLDEADLIYEVHSVKAKDRVVYLKGYVNNAVKICTVHGTDRPYYSTLLQVNSVATPGIWKIRLRALKVMLTKLHGLVNVVELHELEDGSVKVVSTKAGL